MTTKTNSLLVLPLNKNFNCDVQLSDVNLERDEEMNPGTDDVSNSGTPLEESNGNVTSSGSLKICDTMNNNIEDIKLDFLNYNGDKNVVDDDQSVFDEKLNEITNGNHDAKNALINIVDENDFINGSGSYKSIDVHIDENKYDPCTDFVGLELALSESNGKEPFLKELCTKMDTVVKPSAGVDVKLQSLSKDDSTDIEVSYSDSLSPESDQDIGSSYVDSSCQQLQQDIEKKFKTEIESLKWRVLELEKEASHEFCQNQIAAVEKGMEQLKMELDLSRQEHALDSRSFANERLELESKIENLKKEYHAANKDREAAVVRYACGEMELMNQKKEREIVEKKLKDCTKEKEVLINKLKTLTSDKTRICQMLDNKCSELSVAQKEIDSLKEELNSRDIKIKWMQNKLKSETDARKDLETKVEQLNIRIHEVLLEADKAKHDAQDCIKQFQESEENKAYVLSQQLKEEQVKLMLIQHEQDENERCRKQLQHELDACRAKLQASVEENRSLSVKAQTLEEEKLQYEQNLTHLKQKTDLQSKNIAELQDSVKEMAVVRKQLKCEQERVLNNQNEMDRLHQNNAELLLDMESCRKREADMLEFTQKLTAKNVRLQSEFTAVEAKVQQLECEEAPLQKKLVELEGRVSSLLSDLGKEKLQRTEENKVLARHLAEKTTRVKTLEAQVEELTNEIQIVKRKDAAIIKELNRELSQLRRRTDHNESGSGSDSLCHGSRASSCTSLNDHSPTAHVLPPAPTSVSQSTVQVTTIEPNRQALIERIVKLQRDNAKAVEKIDFLEEHTRTLVEELQKKSKVLQSYILREEAGALSSSSMDLNKAELAKHGGIMASVYGSKAMDENMTMELSLEINRKLQAVLEDTLLKNITLKENIDTLGDEIAKLTQKRPHS